MKFFLGITFIAFLLVPAWAQDLKMTKGPEHYQLYTRDENNQSKVFLEGIVLNKDYRRLELKTYKNGELLESKSNELRFNNQGIYNFSINQSIEAGLFQYKFQLSLINDQEERVAFTADSVVCGDAYIITGQSNSHASSSSAIFSSPYCRSFGVKTGFNPYTDEHKKYRWGRATGDSPGLEGIGGWFTDTPFGVGVWGMHLMQKVMETNKIPVCIINGGSGSSTIEQNMASVFQADLNTSFGRLIYRVNEADLTNGVKGILWHQGEGNTVEEYRNYWDDFDTLYHSWKSNFPSLQKIYTFQLHPGCGGDFQSELRDLQYKISDRYTDVEIMSTHGLPGHDGCHYTHEGYVAMAESIYPFLAKDFYGIEPDRSITPPKIIRAYISDQKTSELCLEFDQASVWNNEQIVEGTTYFLKDYFYLNGKPGLIQEGYSHENKIFLKILKGNYNQISYLPGQYYDGTKVIYNGPWIMGGNAIGALSFHNKSIEPIATTYNNLPVDLQLFPRNKNDKAIVPIEGVLLTRGFEKAVCNVYRNGIPYQTMESDLRYSDDKASFSFAPEIDAELAEYTIETAFVVDGKYVKDRVVNNIVCGDVYFINGQSNSHPSRKEAIYRNEYCRSFGSNTNYDAYNPSDTTWGLAAGDISTQYHVSAWGIKLMQQIIEKYEIPVCIINGGSGGSTIEYNLPIESKTDLNSTYNRLLYRAKKAGVDRGVKALLWHQGESDSNDESYNKYAERFKQLYSAWKSDYPSLERIFVFQIHPGCGGERQSEIRETQRGFAKEYNDVEVMSTLGLPGHDGCHYAAEGYSKMGDWIFGSVDRAFYDHNNLKDAGAPNITGAYYTKSGEEICITFDQNILWDESIVDSHKLKDQFYLNGESGKVASGRVEGNKVYLKLHNKYVAENITYLPGHFYEGTGICYEGPWLFGENEIGALSFDNYPLKK